MVMKRPSRWSRWKNGWQLLSFPQRLFLLLSVSSLLVSFTLPAFFIARPGDEAAYSNGCVLFFLGGMSILGGALFSAINWMANPLYIIAFSRCVEGKKSARWLSIIAFLLALIFAFRRSILVSESGAESTITSHGAGYWSWLLALFFLVLAVHWPRPAAEN
jgi:O-antigen/teichoic acid export membrane protein